MNCGQSVGQSATWILLIVYIWCALFNSTYAASVLEPRVRLTAEERYGNAEIFGAFRGDDAGQLISRVSMQPGVRARTENSELEAWYATDFLARHGSGNFSVDHRGHLSWFQRFSPVTQIRSELSLWRVTDPTSLPRLGLARAWEPMFYGKGWVEGRYQLSRRHLGYLGYQGELIRPLTGGVTFGAYQSPYIAWEWVWSSRVSLQTQWRAQWFSEGGILTQGQSPAWILRWLSSPTSQFELTAGAIFYSEQNNWRRGEWAPRLSARWTKTGRLFSVEMNAGQDLIGASGLSAALWAQYATGLISWHIHSRWRIFGVANVYRNGRAPNRGMNPFVSEPASVSQGFQYGAGAEWVLSNQLSITGTVDRFEQVGGLGATPSWAWGMAGMRLVYTPHWGR